MTVSMLELTARDPVVSRDGRPFGKGQGNRMRSVNWPLPSVIAGALRTALGKGAGREFSLETAAELLRVSVAGVFPTADGQLYLPAPQDCVFHPDRGPLRLTPQEVIEHGGGDWPNSQLRPVMLPPPQAAEEDFKPKNAPAWWPVSRFSDWLLGKPLQFDESFLLSPEKEDRTHVLLQPESGSADEGHLFTTSSLVLSHLAQHTSKAAFSEKRPVVEIKLAMRVDADGWCVEQVARLNGHNPTGGERRLVHWSAGGDSTMWDCPATVLEALQSTSRVRMTLATPAIFQDGWKPGWLDHNLTGSPPGSDVRIKLVGVSIGRWQAISGWSLAKINNQGELDSNGKPGPKPIRRMVPAGGVYFFEVDSGSSATLSDCWLQSVSDSEQDRRDGFGLATWGIWHQLQETRI